jgi:hypothetical protein
VIGDAMDLLNAKNGPELFELLSDAIKNLAKCDEWDQERCKDEALTVLKVLTERDVRSTEVFKDTCSRLATNGNCPMKAGLKIDRNVLDTLSCNRNRCIKTKESKKERYCWQIYYYSHIRWGGRQK